MWRFALALMFTLLCAASGHAKGSLVTYTYEAISDKNSINAIANTLGTGVTALPGKQNFLNSIKDKDLVYINAHTYSGKDHPGMHGALVLGSEYKRNPGGSLLMPGELKTALSSGSPQLIVLAGCSGAKYGWTSGVSDSTVISFTKPIHGAGSDIFFKYFLDYWTKNKVSLDEAKAYAIKQARNDPMVRKVAGGVLSKMYDLDGIESSMEIHPDGSLVYDENKTSNPTTTVNLSEKNPFLGRWKFVDGAYVIEISGADGSIKGVIKESTPPEPQFPYDYKVNTTMFENGKMQPDKSMKVEWAQYTWLQPHLNKVLKRGKTSATLRMRPNNDTTFVATGLNRKYETKLWKEVWLNEYGKQFKFSFNKLE